MRMWLVDPVTMCRQHLYGEHVELHMLVGSIWKGISVGGYVDDGLAEIHSVVRRHEELVAEILKRGGNHKSILPELPDKVNVGGIWYSTAEKIGRVDVAANYVELARRCPECRQRQVDFLKSTGV